MITSNNLAGVWTLRDGWRVAFSDLNHAANILRGSAGWLIARHILMNNQGIERRQYQIVGMLDRWV